MRRDSSRAIWRIISRTCSEAKRFDSKRPGSDAGTGCCAARDGGPFLSDSNVASNVTTGSFTACPIVCMPYKTRGPLCVGKRGLDHSPWAMKSCSK